VFASLNALINVCESHTAGHDSALRTAQREAVWLRTATFAPRPRCTSAGLERLGEREDVRAAAASKVADPIRHSAVHICAATAPTMAGLLAHTMPESATGSAVFDRNSRVAHGAAPRTVRISNETREQLSAPTSPPRKPLHGSSIAVVSDVRRLVSLATRHGDPTVTEFNRCA
jgi:hypothetical protein